MVKNVKSCWELFLQECASLNCQTRGNNNVTDKYIKYQSYVHSQLCW